MTYRFQSAARMLAPAVALAALALGGCARNNELNLDNGVGVNTARSLCPSVGVPINTGDITLFDPPASREARAIDVVATITNVRTTCNDEGARVYVSATFDVVASRRDAGAERDVTLPYYSAVVQGATSVVAKDDSRVSLHFPAGQLRASTQGTAGAYVDRTAVTLPDDIRERITRRRRDGDADAAVDPMSEPAVRDAVARATYELLIGFQLSTEQLQYNVTR